MVERDTVLAIFKEMAEVVDRQNAADPAYVPMAPSFDGEAFTAACALALEGTEQLSGYTEPILHAARARHKARRQGAHQPDTAAAAADQQAMAEK